jgi:hypothetical protein
MEENGQKSIIQLLKEKNYYHILIKRKVIICLMAIVAAIFGGASYIVTSFVFDDAGFNIYMEPDNGTINVGNSIQASLYVSSHNGYSYPVSLATNNSNSGIKVSFSPQNNIIPSSISIMTIDINNTLPEDTYKIYINATGFDNENDDCEYDLIVIRDN